MSEEEQNKYDDTKYNKIEPSKPEEEEDDIEEEVRVKNEPIVNVEVTKRKKGLMERLVTGLTGEEGVKSIGAYVGQDIILPAIKNIVADSVTSAINMMMFGDGGSRPGNRGPNTGYSTPKPPRTNYGNRYTPTQNPRAQYGGRPEPKVAKPGKMSTVEDYRIEDRRDAQDVLAKLQHDADSYGTVSVAEYYDMIGVKTDWTDNTYGWYIEDLVNVKIRPVRGGYILSLPNVVYLD